MIQWLGNKTAGQFAGLSVLMAFALLAGCGTKPEAHEHGAHAHRLANGDIQEKTASVEVLPTFLDGQDEHMRQVYALAAQHSELLESIPCYCGCGDSAGHRNNLNCFVHSIEDDGTVVWDDHGTRCNVCLEIALNSVYAQSQGKSVEEIRGMIDRSYQFGYAKPTPTPLTQ